MMDEYDAGYENCINNMVRQMEDMQFRIDSLHRENAKLLELVEAMPYCMYPPKCLKCPLFSKSDPSIGGVPECKARAKLRELGIEVDA